MAEPRLLLQHTPSIAELFIKVDVPDEELAQRGRFFNILLGFHLVAVLLLSVALIIMEPLRLVEAGIARWAGIAPLLYLPVLVGLYSFNRRGHINRTIGFYVWLNFVAAFLACLFFDGSRSPAWLLFLWVAMAAGMLWRPTYALLMSGLATLLYFLLLIFEALGIYMPPFSFSAEARTFAFLVIGLLMVLFAGGVLTFLTTRNLSRVVARSQEMTVDLLQTRESLERDIASRTQTLELRAQQFQTIAELTRAIAGILDMEVLLETSVKLIAERLGYYHVGVYLLDAQQEWAILRAASSEGGQRMLARGHREAVGEHGVAAEVAAVGRPRIAMDVGEEATWFNNPDLPLTRSELALPMAARGQTLGVLDIQSQHESAFRTEDLQVFGVLADGLAIALDNTRLLSETRQALQRLNRYQETDALRGWRQALARRDLQINYLYDQVELRAVDVEEVAAVEFDETLESVRTAINAEGQYTLLAPVRIRGRLVGALSFESLHPWAEEDLRLAESVVQQLGLALENARLLEEARLRALQEQARGEIVGRVRASVNVDSILRSAAEELGRAFQLERARVQLLPRQVEED